MFLLFLSVFRLLLFTSFSNLASCTKISLCVSANALIFVNTLIILISTSIAILLFKTLDNIATTCSVKAKGIYLVPPQLEVPNWLLKFSNSLDVSSNIKSLGNLSILRFTCLFNYFVSTAYISARSLSTITFSPLIT